MSPIKPNPTVQRRTRKTQPVAVQAAQALDSLAHSIKWNNYIPHDPSPKQLAFLLLNDYRELLYGGAAGGGKSDALLMAALQYVDVPNYAAILFRRKFSDLRLPGALISRAMDWLDGTDAKWNGVQHEFRFPNNAKLAFGYLDTEFDIHRYQSAEFQFIGFDELTQFPEENEYLYLFSRLRRPKCQLHSVKPDPNCQLCTEYQGLLDVPLRMRAATNPGGIGHIWVKNRFQISLQIDPTDGTHRYLGLNPHRPYIPAFARDNPAIDPVEYEQSLKELDPVTRKQLLDGDWSVAADGRFRKAWVKRYTTRGEYFVLENKTWHASKLRLFATVDPAASVKQGPGDKDVWRRNPSWSVISYWLVTPDFDLLWFDCIRFQKEVPEVVNAIRDSYLKYANTIFRRPEFIGIEGNGLGIGVLQSVARLGLPVRNLKPNSGDKLVRATPAANRMEQGRIWFPTQISLLTNSALNAEAIQALWTDASSDQDQVQVQATIDSLLDKSNLRYPWLEDVESEVFTWTGHPLQPADIVDTLAYAAAIVQDWATTTERWSLNPLLSGNTSATPFLHT